MTTTITAEERDGWRQRVESGVDESIIYVNVASMRGLLDALDAAERERDEARQANDTARRVNASYYEAAEKAEAALATVKADRDRQLAARDEAEAACAVMRDALHLCRLALNEATQPDDPKAPHAHTSPLAREAFAAIDAALATDAGKALLDRLAQAEAAREAMRERHADLCAVLGLTVSFGFRDGQDIEKAKGLLKEVKALRVKVAVVDDMAREALENGGTMLWADAVRAALSTELKR